MDCTVYDGPEARAEKLSIAPLIVPYCPMVCIPKFPMTAALVFPDKEDKCFIYKFKSLTYPPNDTTGKLLTNPPDGVAALIALATAFFPLAAKSAAIVSETAT